jgi:hypothetical protein
MYTMVIQVWYHLNMLGSSNLFSLIEKLLLYIFALLVKFVVMVMGNTSDNCKWWFKYDMSNETLFGLLFEIIVELDTKLGFAN